MCPTDAIKYSKNSKAGTWQDELGHHVLVDFVRYLKWDYTQPEVEAIYSISELDEAFLSKFFQSWDVPLTEEQDCWHCGWPWSSRHRCPAWGVKCHRCGLPNHYARMCHTGSEDQCSNPDSESNRSSSQTKKRAHRKRKKTAKQRLRDQDRLQTFLKKKAMEQELLEQGIKVEELEEIVGSVAAAFVVGDEELAHAGEWESAKMNKIHEAAMLDTTSSTSKEVDEMNSNTLTQRPLTLESTPKKKILPNLDLLRDDQDDSILANASVSSSEGEALDSFNDLQTPDDLTTPEAFGDSVFEGELDWEESENSDETPGVEPIPEYTAKEEFEDEKNWRTVTVGDRQFRIDMKVIEPYKKVLSHGGYYGDGFNAIIVFAGCYLPDKRRRDYHYVMDNLFLYVLSTLELLVVEDYMVVYFHGATPKQKMPSLRWLKRCYDMIDRRLRKNLKALLIVHPTLWLRTIMALTKPFISSKFSSKLRYIRSLKDLEGAVPMEYIFVPDEIKMFDAAKFRQNPPSPTAT